MRKALSVLLAGLLLLSLMAACAPASDSPSSNPGNTDNSGTASPAPLASPTPADLVPEDQDPDLDGTVFKEKRQITVEVFERNNIARTPADNNVYTDWIKDEFLKAHNVEITEYVSMPRWEEDTTIPLWLAGGDCPDVCLTYNFTAIQEYGNMGAVHDLAPLIDGYRDRLPNLWDLLGETNMYGSRNPETGTVYWLETMKADNSRINTFVREDWLTTLGLAAPTTTQEFEDMLIAFRDNAELLMPGNADKLVPLSMGQDVGWRSENLMMSFVPDDLSARDKYILGYDDRHILYPGYKEGMRLLNKWYNDKLIWQNFSIYPIGDSTEDDMIKAGYVGAFIHNWDYPYRSGSDLQVTLQREVGPEAAFIAVDPFVNDAGNRMKLLSSSFDRKIFFPLTNEEPKASIFFCDFISRPEVIQFLQLGFEGINYDINEDGVPVNKPVVSVEKNSDGQDEVVGDQSNLPYIINSGQNIDLTITINGYYPGGLTAGALATGYVGVDPKYILAAIEAARNDGITIPQLNVGEILSESGMTDALKNKRDAFLNQAVTASPSDFDKVFDEGMANYLNSGGQAIIDERTQRYEASFGTEG